MKVLFDQNLPHNLRTALVGTGTHEIVTAAFMGWGLLRNGDLLRAAEAGNIQVFVTADGTLVHEQNMAGRAIAVVVLSANSWPIIRNYVARILTAIDDAAPGSVQLVDCGKFSRQRESGQI